MCEYITKIGFIIFLLSTLFCTALADDIDYGMRRGAMVKMLREMVNQSNADTLNLPANSTSIRENITDTFSCENRTYGYYADMDNDCQIFHVCLPTTSASGRNVTYRWSFICPAETVFNQEVLVCTRPRESIECEESAEYYYKNLEFGKVNDTAKLKNRSGNRNKIRRQNLVVETILKDAVEKLKTATKDFNIDAVPNEYETIIEEVVKETDDEIQRVDNSNEVIETVKRFGERSLNNKRRGFRFKADVF